MKRTLILGLGNILLQDEGLGVRAVERIAARFALPDGVQALDGGVMGLNLLPYLEGVDQLLILDVVQAGQAPGTVVRLEGDAIPAALSLKVTMHQMGVRQLLALAGFQGSLTARVVLWGVEPGSLEWGVGLSPAIESQLDVLVEQACRELAEWGAPLIPSFGDSPRGVLPFYRS